MPAPIGAVAGLDENIRLQNRTAAEAARALRHMRGALSLQTIQARPVFVGDMLQDLQPDQSNVAKNLIEELMVAANGVTARFLEARRFPRSAAWCARPAKWDRIVELAAEKGATLPGQPDGGALEEFLRGPAEGGSRRISRTSRSASSS